MEKKELQTIPIRILIINGSNRRNGNSHLLLQKAVDELEKYKNIEFEILEIYNKNYGRHDNPKDAEELIKQWNWADTVLFFIPNYTVGGPGTLYSALERLSEALEEDVKNGVYQKTAGVLVQGSSKYGMAELAMESTFQMLVGIHTLPIYRLVAHIPDGTKPDLELFSNVDVMVKETVTGARLFKVAQDAKSQKQSRVLVINAGMDDREIGIALEERALKRLESTEGIVPEVFRFPEEPLRDCHHCNQLCRERLRCAFDDSFQDFFAKWIRADGIVWIVSGGQNGVPAEVHYMHDRLSETGFSTVSDRVRRLGVPYRFCRYTKPEGAIAYGKYGYAGQTQAQQFFVNVAEQRGNYYITGRKPASLGPAALIRQETQLGCDMFFTKEVDALTDDVARITRGIQAAKALLFDELPEFFYNSRTHMGIPNKEDYFNE